jgi:methylated-DNA-[protein]-cysteine S-methyltransferase
VNTLFYNIFDSPLGPLMIAADRTHLLLLEFDAGQRSKTRLEKRFGTAIHWMHEPGHCVLVDTATQLQEYFRGTRQQFDLPITFVGTDFETQVWTALLDIPYGHTCTYGQQAKYLGMPSASRAVGAANGRNFISIIVPCHRVVGATGSLTGYGGGVDRKARLLEHERQSLGQSPRLFEAI